MLVKVSVSAAAAGTDPEGSAATGLTVRSGKGVMEGGQLLLATIVKEIDLILFEVVNGLSVACRWRSCRHRQNG